MSVTMPFGAGAMGRIRRLHFVGVGGSGMSGIAELMVDYCWLPRSSVGANPDAPASINGQIGRQPTPVSTEVSIPLERTRRRSHAGAWERASCIAEPDAAARIAWACREVSGA